MITLARKLFAASALGFAITGTAMAFAPMTPITPGEWETIAKISSVGGAGPMGMVAKLMQGRTTKLKYCITPEQAARGPQDMLKQNKSCAFTHYSMIGGQLDSEMVCHQGGSTMTVVSNVAFTPTHFSGSSQMTSDAGAGTTMSSTSEGNWIGPCK